MIFFVDVACGIRDAIANRMRRVENRCPGPGYRAGGPGNARQLVTS